MSIYAGPNTTKNDSSLVLHLDAANKRSYPGSGTTWYDLSGNKNNGTLTNGPTFNTANRGSIVFDGINDYIDCGNDSILHITSNITLSAWIKMYSISSEMAVIDKGGINGHHFGIYLSKIIFQPQVSYRLSNTILTTNIWYNIAITYNKSIVNFYLNGFPDGTQSITGGLNAPSSPVWIGRYDVSQLLSFHGIISIASMYSRILTPNEIKQNYNSTRGRFGL